ncbi:MAG: signal peptidase [Anaerocolumna sp.]|jgi:signal peptidase I|nr:signal peptidase [Anaerocolumna sp.]
MDVKRRDENQENNRLHNNLTEQSCNENKITGNSSIYIKNESEHGISGNEIVDIDRDMKLEDLTDSYMDLRNDFLGLKYSSMDTENKSKDFDINDTDINDIDNKNTDNKETDKDTLSNKDGKETNYLKEILEMVIYFAVVICSVFLIHQFVGQQIEVSGSSMENTLQNKDHLILEKLSYEFGDPKRFDIVVFRPYAFDEDTYYIKRVIGLPGESIQIIESDIYINNELLVENYGNEPIIDGGIANDVIKLGEDEYFLLGDNRNNSKDSRDSSVGIVHSSAIIGRAWVRIWPINKIEVLEHQ